MKRFYKFIIIFFLFFILINNVNALDIPQVSAKNVYFINIDDNDLIYEKNSDEKVKIASLTKIMTALVSIENINNFDEKVIVTNDMISSITLDYAVVGFKTSDVVTYNDLLYGLMLKSGADSANILAYSISSSYEEFINLMNKKAQELKMKNTHFSNPIGMDNNNYSTASDMAKLLTYASKNEKFMEIFKTEDFVTSTNIEVKGPLKKLHYNDLNMPYLLGSKTGFTDDAGLCLASLSNYNNKNYVLIILGCEKDIYYSNHMYETKTLFDFFFNNYDYKKILSKKQKIKKIKTQYDEEYIIYSKEDVIKYIEKTKEKEDLTYKYIGNKVLTKDINKGDKIGTYYIYDNEDILYKTDILSTIDVKMPIKYFLKHNLIYIIGVFLIMIVLVKFVKKNF